MKKRTLILTSIMMSMTLLAGCGSTETAASSSNTAASASTDNTADPSGNAETTAASATGSDNSDPTTNDIDGLFLTSEDINFKDSDEYVDYTSNGYVSISLEEDTASVSGSGVTVDGSDLTITSAGTYVISGTLNGSITVNVTDEDKVILVLNGATITSSDAPAIYVENADKVTISLVDGTTNTLTDGDSRSDEELDATIYSSDDLVFNGTGSLVINSNFSDAIHSKDDLRIIDGNYTITSVDDGIVGKDRLEIKNGTFNITANGKGLKSTNSDEDGLGFIYIENGTFNIDTEDDAIHGATAVWIVDGTYTISSGDDGIHGDETLTIDGGTINVEESVEGLEAAEIVLNGGTISVNASDDGINAAGGNEEESGSSNDDGDISGMRMGGGMMSTSDGYLYINGGDIYVSADGDGLDANCSIYQTGGDVIVEGPTNSGNGTLDYDQEYLMTGGSLLGSGSTGMLQTISNSSSVYSLTVIYNSQQSAGSTYTLQDSEGNVITTYSPSKTYSAVTFASEALEADATYSIYSGDTKLCDVTLDSTNKMVDESGSDTSAGMGVGNMGGGRGMGGGRSMGGGRDTTDGEMPEDMTPPTDGEMPEAPIDNNQNTTGNTDL